MYCKTKSLFRSCTSEVVLEGYEICSPIYDFTDIEDDSINCGNANVGRKKSKKHKRKSKHKRRRHKERRKEKEKNQEQGQNEELPDVEPHEPLKEKKNAEQKPFKFIQPAVPYKITCDSIQK